MSAIVCGQFAILGERDRPGDDDQWRRLKPMAPHIRRLANAERRAEEVDDV